MWPISTRVNKPENDDPPIVEPIELTTDAAQLRPVYGEPNRRKGSQDQKGDHCSSSRADESCALPGYLEQSQVVLGAIKALVLCRTLGPNDFLEGSRTICHS
jgi:hypothetical protein